MAYFPNGTDYDYYAELYCNKCVHRVKGELCPVIVLHYLWNYDAVGEKADKTKRTALGTLWPQKPDGIHNAACAMFYPKPQEGHWLERKDREEE